MKTIFEHMTINHILIEEGQTEAIVDATILQNGKTDLVKLYLSNTDLNRLFLKLQTLGIEVSLSESFNCYQTAEGNLYTLDMKSLGWDNITISDFSPVQEIRQIRA